jgi:hypothetical protein
VDLDFDHGHLLFTVTNMIAPATRQGYLLDLLCANDANNQRLALQLRREAASA